MQLLLVAAVLVPEVEIHRKEQVVHQQH